MRAFHTSEQEDRFHDPKWGAERLQDISLFSCFTASELTKLYQYGQLVRLKNHSHVVVEGEPSRGVYLLLKGTVSVYKNDTATGQMIRLTMLDEGESFGEISLFDDAPRSATVVCESICHLFHLEHTNFSAFLDRYGDDVKLRFFKNCAEYLAQRLRGLNSDYLESQKLLWTHALRR